jgi:hypothetical protein
MMLIFLGMLAGKGVLIASKHYSIAQLQDDSPSKRTSWASASRNSGSLTIAVTSRIVKSDGQRAAFRGFGGHLYDGLRRISPFPSICDTEGARYDPRWGVLTAVTFALALGSPAAAAPAPESGNGAVHAAVTAAALPTAFPGCSWPLETTPSKVNVAAPDPYATYWTTPFIASAGNSLTSKGSFPTSRFMSFTVYNDSFQDFTNTVGESSDELYRPRHSRGYRRSADVRERHPDDRPEPAG